MKKRIRLIALICLIALTCGLIFSACATENTPEDPTQDTDQTESTQTKVVAMQIDDIVVTKNMMSYFFRSNYAKLLGKSDFFGSSFGSTPYALLGIDPDKSLKEQQSYAGANTGASSVNSNGAGGTSWYDYLLKQTQETVSQHLIYAAAAKDAGVTLTAEDEKKIDAKIAELIVFLRQSEHAIDTYSEDKCCEMAFGKGVKKKDVREAIALETLAKKMSNTKEQELRTAIKKDTDRITATYNEDPNLFHYADYLSFSFEVYFILVAEELYPDTSIEDLSDTQKEHVKTVYKEEIAIARQNAATLATKKTVEEYNEFISTFTNNVERALHEHVAYYGDSEDAVENWVFDAARKALEAKSFESGDKGSDIKSDTATSFTSQVVMLTKPSYKLETLSRDFVYLLYNSKTNAEKAIEAVKKLDELNAESFLKISEDKNNPTIAQGSFEDCAMLTMQSDEFDEWLFDEKLKEGSYTQTPLAMSDGSYVVALYAKQNSTPEWKHRVIEVLASEDYVEFENNITEKFKSKIKYFDKILSKLEDSATSYIDDRETIFSITSSGAAISTPKNPLIK